MAILSQTVPAIAAGPLLTPGHPGRAAALGQVAQAARETGFMVLHEAPITAADVARVIEAFAAFFALPAEEKARVGMARTGSNRGWGAPLGEQVDPQANPDYKEVFDIGLDLAPDDPLTALPFYGPNLWPERPAGFRTTMLDYYARASRLSLGLLGALAEAIGEEAHYFDDKFAAPMALLRGNYYPPRPAWAGARDYGIAPHTDYGCLTLLASDGVPGLEVETRTGNWIAVEAPPGSFVINFGEMFEMWTGGRVRATPHRVRGGPEARLSVPFFFNPSHDTNVAPIGSGRVIRAGDYLARRFRETYVHLQETGEKAP